MRKIFIGVASLAILAAACAKSSVPVGSASAPTTTAASVDPAACAQGATLHKPGTLTIGTDNPAYPPYFVGNAPKGSVWKLGDPTNGKGFESAVAYAVAAKMGFATPAVAWIALPYTESYAPGQKKFDMYLAQVSYKAARARSADFSSSYYDVNQALVAVKGTPITSVTTVSGLKDHVLAAPLGSTSADYITNVIQPTKQPGVYKTLSDAVAALNAHQVDGIVVDLPTSLFIADPYVQEVKNSTVVGQFPNPAGTTPEHFGIVLPLHSSLTPCVDAALTSMRDDGSLRSITTTWLSQKTNVGNVPVFAP
ncbi:MAG: ABC transporter substrate-binding protein [Actinomycetota bacterium]|nr:ABC transporter substrate-binding protein [Actinomycetota bacterium]